MEMCSDFGLQLKDNTIYVDSGKSELINSCIVFEGSKNILFVEDGCYLHNSKIIFHNDNSVVYLSKNFYKYFLNLSVFNDNCVYIGKDCYFNGPINILAGEHQNILIGNDILFSFGISLKTVDGHLIFRTKDMKRTNYSKSILIGDHIWVGQQTLILKGTIIGSGSVIGACSVVANKQISSNTAWAGNPVRKISDNISFSKELTQAWKINQTQNVREAKVQEGLFLNTDDKIDMREIDYKLQKCENTQDRLSIIKEFLVLQRSKDRFFVGETRGLIAWLKKCIRHKGFTTANTAH